MRLSERIRTDRDDENDTARADDLAYYEQEAAQLEEENEALKEWRKQAITAFKDIDHEACIDYLDALLKGAPDD